MDKTALVILARVPEEGKVKTRLAATLGTATTLRLYRAFLSDLFQRFVGWQEEIYTLYWAYTPDSADHPANLADLLPGVWSGRSFPQRGSDLNSRLRHAFATTAAAGFHKTILVGSDTPQLGRELITQARLTLDQADIVLGPAEDGGYYLLAMHQPYDLFSGIPMSTQQVLQMTLERAHSLDLSTRLLTPLFDIDEYAELLRLSALLKAEPELASTTAAVISSLKEGIDHDNYCPCDPASLDLYRANQPLQ